MASSLLRASRHLAGRGLHPAASRGLSATSLTSTLEQHAKQLLVNMELGDARAVVPDARATLDRQRAIYGDRHPRTIASINSLAGLLIVDGKLEEAQPLIQESVNATLSLTQER